MLLFGLWNQVDSKLRLLLTSQVRWWSIIIKLDGLLFSFGFIVFLTAAPNNATIKVGDEIRFICDAGHFLGRISNMRLHFVSFFRDYGIDMNGWIEGIATYLYSNIPLHLNSNNVSCVITDDFGDNYSSNTIPISVEGSYIYIYILCI